MEQQLFDQLIEAAKKDRRGLARLKDAVVKLKQYELAGKIRQIETDAFPESDEVKGARAQAREVKGILGMIGINAKNNGTCWILCEAMKVYAEKNILFSLEDAAALQVKMEQIFEEESE